MKKTIFLTILFILVSSFGFSQQENFKKANDLYSNDKFEEAIEQYEQILNDGYQSVALYYNLANAHYKLNHVAESVYYYEKAVQLDPNNEDVKNNLSFAKKMTIDAIEVIPQSGFSKMFNKLVGSFTYNTWAKIGIGFAFLFIVAFIIYYTAYTTSRKRSFFIISMFNVIFMLLAILFAYQQENFVKNNNFGIVFAKETSIKAEPKQSSNESFKLHEGTKVKLLEPVEGWYKIRLADGKVGWILATDIKAL